VKTSLTSPIYVDFLDPPTPLGGQDRPDNRAREEGRPLWTRDLDTDLGRLRDEYKCNLLVSLMSPTSTTGSGYRTCSSVPRTWHRNDPLSD